MDTYTTVLVCLSKNGIAFLKDHVELELDTKGEYNDSCLHDIAMGYLKEYPDATRCGILDGGHEIFTWQSK